MTSKTVFLKVPSIYIPPIYVKPEELQIQEMNRNDLVIKLFKVVVNSRSGRFNYTPSTAFLERWVILNKGGLPITFHSRESLVEVTRDTDSDKFEDFISKYNNGEDCHTKIFTRLYEIHSKIPYSDEEGALIQVEKYLDYNRPDELVNDLELRNAGEYGISEAHIQKQISDAKTALFDHGYIEGIPDFESVVESVAESYAEE
jgi:hypothetical protein